MKNVKIKEDIIMIIITSFIGFCIENFYMLFKNSVIDNRNMYLPFLLGYGLFAVAFYYIIGTPKKIFNKYELKTPKNFLVYMLICFIIVSAGEIILGTFVEKTGHFYYWDYTGLPMHFTRYASVLTSIGFSLAITLFMAYLYIPLENKVKKISKHVPMFFTIFIFIVLVIDMTVSFKNMYINGGKNSVWKINIKK